MARPPLELVRGPDGPDADGPDSVGGQTPFDALLRAAARDADAASGLALAYAEMTTDARTKLIDAVAPDPNALALLLGVEEDPALAWKIAVALRTFERGAGQGGLASARRDAAFEWGDVDEGGVGLVRHLHGEFVDALRVSWSAGTLDVEALPVSTGGDAEALGKEVGVPSDGKRVPFERGVDRLTEVLWRIRREGRVIPAAVRRFADVFTVTRRP